MAKTQNITTDTALVNIVNTQRYAILACLDDVVSLARNDELNWYFEDLDDLLNTNIDRVVEVVCACSTKFDMLFCECKPHMLQHRGKRTNKENTK